MGLLSDNPRWEAVEERALTRAVHGGADFGECTTTVQRVGAGAADDWYREWTGTAARVAAIGDERATNGHTVSAREEFANTRDHQHQRVFDWLDETLGL